MLFRKPFTEITAADVCQLLADCVRESKELDYKQALPTNTDGDKREFLKDIASFANSGGGWIIYGIEEKRDQDGHKTGEPGRCTGVQLTSSADAEILRLDNLIVRGIAPSISQVRIRDIADPNFPDGPVVLIQVPDSWARPHMITLRADSRFYGRNNAGKFPMDVDQIRSAFLSSDSLVERVESFRRDRVAMISRQQGSVPTVGPGRLVLHVLPLRSFELGPPDVTILAEQKRPSPISSSGDMVMPNFDGYLTYRRHPDAYTTESYLQVFRNGCIEAVDCPTLNTPGADLYRIPSVFLAEKLGEATRRYLSLCESLGLDAPYVVMLSLLGLEQHRLVLSTHTEGPLIRREEMLLPGILLQDPSSEAEGAVRRMLDIIWQAGGFSEYQPADR